MKQKKSVQTLLQEARQAWALGDASHAEKTLLAATQASKSSADAWASLGFFYSQTRRYPNAADAYHKAFKLKQIPDLFYPYGNALYNIGQLEEALPWLQRALTLKGENLDHSWHNFTHCFCAVHPPERWHELAQYQPPQTDLALWSYASGLRFEVLAAFFLAQQNRFNELNPRLQNMVPELSKIDPAGLTPQQIRSRQQNQKNLVIYINYIQKLAELTDWQPAQNPPLYVIGDSHSLSFSNHTVSLNTQAFTAQTRPIIGCKAHHLGQPDPNYYQATFRHILASLPPNAPLLITCGEIDCRHTEGMLPYTLKHKANLEQVILHTVTTYLAFLKQHQGDHSLTVCGVAAPHPEIMAQVAEPLKPVLLALIQTFNRLLQEQALNAGFSFVDIYAATAQANGLADPALYLERRHLYPATWATALAQHLHTPAI